MQCQWPILMITNSNTRGLHHSLYLLTKYDDDLFQLILNQHVNLLITICDATYGQM